MLCFKLYKYMYLFLFLSLTLAQRYGVLRNIKIFCENIFTNMKILFTFALVSDKNKTFNFIKID